MPELLDVAAIRRRWENASAGDWQWSKPSGFIDLSAVRTHVEHRTNDPEFPVRSERTLLAENMSAADAEFMAGAHTDIPALLDALVHECTERSLLQSRLDAALLANQNSGDPDSFVKVRDALQPDLGELVVTWPCMECGSPIKFRENPKLGGAVFQHLEEPDFPHFPVRAPGDRKLRNNPATLHRPSTTPIEGEAR